MIVHMTGVRANRSRTAVLHGVDLTVPAGQVTGLLGPNGAGKSTTLRILLGLLRATEGSVQLFGRPWERSALHRVGASVDGPSFYPHLTGRENLAVHARLIGVGKREIDRSLEAAGIAEVADKRSRKYSTGMRSRLATAIALLGDPELVILDEPQNGLDPAGIREVRHLMSRVASEGRTVLFSSHVLAEVGAVADHIVCLDRGRTAWSGRLADLAPDADLESAYFRIAGRRP